MVKHIPLLYLSLIALTLCCYRSEMAYCLSDVEFLAKLHGVRLAFEVICDPFVLDIFIYFIMDINFVCVYG